MASSTSNGMSSEHLEISKQTKDLVELCKIVVNDMQNGEKTLESLDEARKKQKKYKGKTQLRSLYSQAISEAESQKSVLTDALSKINHIRELEHHLRMSMGPRNIRRGVLMSVLQENAKSVPLWLGKSGSKAPPLCGAVPAAPNFVAQSGDHVAALVPEPDVAATACNLTEGCILAEVVSYDSDKKVYQVEDIDSEEGKTRYTLHRSKIIPLPKWKADPNLFPEVVFRKGAVHDDYSLYFEDSTYPEGYAPAIRIPQRYVVDCREKKTGTAVNSPEPAASSTTSQSGKRRNK